MNRRRRLSGQTAVEFALVLPLVLIFLSGVIAGSYLFFQNNAVGNGSRAGSRMATIESNLYKGTGPYCEEGKPDTIVNAVKGAANILPLNSGALCATSPTRLVQNSIDMTKAYIIVDAAPNLGSPACVTVTVIYNAPSLPGPFATNITMVSHSGAPVGTGPTATCPPGADPLP
jgi:Flp pilus assembly protein TadG